MLRLPPPVTAASLSPASWRKPYHSAFASTAFHSELGNEMGVDVYGFHDLLPVGDLPDTSSQIKRPR